MKKIIITRTDAKKKGLTHYYTGFSCVNGHDAPRYVSNTECVVCRKNQTNNWNANNRKRLYELQKRYKSTEKGRLAEKNSRERVKLRKQNEETC